MSAQSPVWEEETLYTSGDEYFAALLKNISEARNVIELESYIYEKGILGDRVNESLIAAAKRGVRVRVIVDGWGSPGFANDYWPQLKANGVRVRFFRVPPWILKRVPGDPDSFRRRLANRLQNINQGNHRKFCLIDHETLWVGSFNVSDVHLREVHGDEAWKDIGVCVRGPDLKYARRAFQRAFRGWTALNLPARSPRLLLLNDSYLHKRRARVQLSKRLRHASTRIWVATPYFVPVGRMFRLLARQARRGRDVRVMIPEKNDVWIMKWISLPLLNALARKKVKIYIYGPRFSHQKVFVADDWVCIGSTNLNHRSFLHDLEMDIVITHEHNKRRILENYLRDQSQSQIFDKEAWAHVPFWMRALSYAFRWMKYWS